MIATDQAIWGGGTGSGADSDGFGDGSNDWWGGLTDFASDPSQAVEDPYGTVAGAADAATLNFDEGVGGLTSLIDDDAGNTAGPGQEAAFDPDGDGGAEPWQSISGGVAEGVEVVVEGAQDGFDAATEAAAPEWFNWILDHQEEVLIAALIVLVLYAEDWTGGGVSTA